ncbi:MAG: hypothetical protein EOP01_08850, partial [Propionibacteriaceae bacterium]
VALVTNVEADHLDNYGTEEAYRAAFSQFLDRIDPAGFLVACIDDPGSAALLAEAAGRGLAAVGVGIGSGPDAPEVRAENLRQAGSTSTFEVVDRGRRLGEVQLQVPGQHYVQDALAALACGLRLGFPFADLARGLGAYSGTRRRMELKGEVGGIRVYDSYAHHPREIVGDLEAARSLVGQGRLVVAFQPHMVSRTRIFGTEMGVALGAADEVVVMDIYVAREDPEPGVTAALVADAVPLPADQVVFEREEVLTQAGKPYSVFTPYSRAWLARLDDFYLRAYPVERYAARLAPRPEALRRPVPSLQDLGFEPTNLRQLPIPTGASGGQALLEAFTQRIDRYDATRDLPGVKGPSYLGVHLRFGTVSI